MSLLNAKIGPKAPDIVNTIIEIPRGSANKYEVDANSGLIKLDRVLFSPLFYPSILYPSIVDPSILGRREATCYAAASWLRPRNANNSALT